MRLFHHDPKHDLITAVPGLERLRRGQVQQLEQLLDEIELPVGATLVREGELAREFLIVVEGNATVTIDGEPVGNVGAGAFVGEMALLGRRPRRSATVRALTPMRVLIGDARTLDAVLDVDPSVRLDVERTARQREERNNAA